MKVTKTRLKEIILEEVAAVQEAAINPTSARVSASQRKKELDEGARRPLQKEAQSAKEYYAEKPDPFDALFPPGSGKKSLDRTYQGKVITPQSVAGKLLNLAAEVEASGRRRLMTRAIGADLIRLSNGIPKKFQSRVHFLKSLREHAKTRLRKKLQLLLKLKVFTGLLVANITAWPMIPRKVLSMS